MHAAGMRKVLLMLAAIFASAPAADYPAAPAAPTGPLDFVLRANDGTDYPLAQHKGQVVLLVNVASKCGFTKQYAGLQELYARHKDAGLVVIGVPANDFLWQEPGDDAAIAAFCRTSYGVTFPIMAKTTVKGGDITPLYAWLTAKGPFPGAISWNFNKFLIGRDGQVKARFGSRSAPEDAEMVEAVTAALAARP
jgi:glutathione peroxidase